MIYKDDIDMTKKRMNAFWNREIIDRCCVVARSYKDGAKPFDYFYDSWQNMKTPEDQFKFWTDPEVILKRDLNRFENTFFGGESFPVVCPQLGVSGHAGFFKGARYDMKNSFWFFPSILDITRDKLEFDPDAFLYKQMFEIVKYLAEEAKDRYIISVHDYTGDLDCLAHLRGSDNLMMDMVDDPDWVKESLFTIDNIWRDFMDKIYDIITPVNKGYNSVGWLSTLAKGKHAQIQCDISVMLSNTMFKEFVVPEIRRKLDWMDHSLYHFDGMEQIRHLDDLLAMEKLDAIQWTGVTGQPSPVEFIPELKKIQAAGKCLIIRVNNKEYETLLTELSSKGLLLLTFSETEDEARRKLALAERLTHE